MAVSIIEAVQSGLSLSSELTVSATTTVTPEAGDIVVVLYRSVKASSARLAMSVSGMGATFTQRYQENQGSLWTGSGATMAGTVTVSQNQIGTAQIAVYLVRGLTATTTVGRWGALAGGTDFGHEELPAGDGQVAFAWAYGQDATLGTITYPNTQTPATGWTFQAAQSNATEYARNGHRVPTESAAYHRVTAIGVTGDSKAVWMAVVGDPVASNAQIESVYTEVLATGSPSAQVEAVYAEALTSNYLGRVLADAPLAYWKLSETSGTSMADWSGNGKNGTYSGATLGQTKLHPDSSTAALGTATGQGIGSIPGSAIPTSETLSVSFWVKFNNTNDVAGLVSRFGAGGIGWVVWQRAGRIAFTVINSGGQQDKYGPTFASGQTAHVTLIQDGTLVRLLVDGHEVLTNSVGGTYASLATVPLQIGGYNGSNYSSATISDVAYWNRALTVDDVFHHVTGGSKTVVAVDPSTLTGLAARFDAQAITGKVDGDPVSSWTDQSGNAKHAINATSTQQPVYKTNIYNGKPVVRFDGTNDFLNATDVFAAPDNSLTVFMVCAVRSLPALQIPWSIQTGTGGSAVAVNGSGTRALFSVGVWVVYSGGTTTTGVFERQSVVGRDMWTNNGSIMRVNGAITQLHQNFGTGQSLRIGNSPSQDYPAPIDVAEMLVFDRPLSDRDARAVDLYLQEKWESITSSAGFTMGLTGVGEVVTAVDYRLQLRAKDLGGVGTSVTSWTDAASGVVYTPTGTAPVVTATTLPSGGKAVSGGAIAVGMGGGHSIWSSPVKDCTASSRFNTTGTYDPGNIAGATGEWASNTSGASWWKVELKTAGVVTGYSMTAVGGARNPRNWTFEGSNDNTNWTVLDTQTGQLNGVNTGSWSFSNATAYKYYKFNFTLNGGDIYHLTRIDFTGVTMGFTMPAASEIWAVVRSSQTAGSGNGHWLRIGTAHYTWSDNWVYDFYGHGGRAEWNPVVDVKQWRIYRATMNATEVKRYIDGVQRFGGGGGTPNLPRNISFLGASHEVAEILVRDKVSSTAEAQTITDYLIAEHFTAGAPEVLEATGTLPFTVGLSSEVAAVPVSTGQLPLTAGLLSTVETIPDKTGTLALTVDLDGAAYGVTEGLDLGFQFGTTGNAYGTASGAVGTRIGASATSAGVTTGLLGMALDFSMRDAGVVIAGLPMEIGQQVQDAGTATSGVAFTVGTDGQSAGTATAEAGLSLSLFDSTLDHFPKFRSMTVESEGWLTTTTTRRITAYLGGVGQLLSITGQSKTLDSALAGTGTLTVLFDQTAVELVASTEGFGTLLTHLVQSLQDRDITVWFAGPVTESRYATGPAAGVGTGHGPYLENDYGFGGPED